MIGIDGRGLIRRGYGLRGGGVYRTMPRRSISAMASSLRGIIGV